MATKEETDIRLREIKRSFNRIMDGTAAKSMRDKGLDYKLNWGASVAMLKDMAKDLGKKDRDLAEALWKEDIRECKILATMVMPFQEMPEDLAEKWMEETKTLEVAEMAALNLYQHLPYAADKAFRWIASENQLGQVSGFHILSRLFMKGITPNEKGMYEYLDQTMAALKGGKMPVAKAALASLYRFAELGIVYERMAKSTAKENGLDVF